MAENINTAFEQTYGITRQRTLESGILVIPVAGEPGTPPEIVRVHAGVEYETVNFAAEKQGAPPTVPHPTLADTNCLFLGGNQSADVPLKQPQQHHVWTMKGSYLYVHQRPVGLASSFPTGLMPFEVGSPSSNVIPSTVFSQQIIGADAPPVLQNPIQIP